MVAGETNQDGGNLTLTGGTATGNGTSTVKILAAGGRDPGAKESTPTNAGIFSSNGLEVLPPAKSRGSTKSTVNHRFGSAKFTSEIDCNDSKEYTINNNLVTPRSRILITTSIAKRKSGAFAFIVNPNDGYFNVNMRNVTNTGSGNVTITFWVLD
ncbi:MAG TPA: hypothetical protein QGF02_03555 [Candidatus Babeliales bacterium]|nr:hypothetical protein [Candidatus Babeliales bacterium]